MPLPSVAGLIVSTSLVSVYSVGLIAIDRYLYIVYGLQYQRYLTRTRARILIAATWIIGEYAVPLPAITQMSRVLPPV